MKNCSFCLVMLLLAGCSTGGHDSVMSKVKYDFGIGEAPEGYVSGTDLVFKALDKVGDTELKRMNAKNRLGELKYQEDGVRGLHYKEVKVFESHHALDAQAMSRGVNTERGYFGYVEYRYQIFQSERRPTETEASALSANVPTGVTGSETYRYTFGPGGTWNGQEGERANR